MLARRVRALPVLRRSVCAYHVSVVMASSLLTRAQSNGGGLDAARGGDGLGPAEGGLQLPLQVRTKLLERVKASALGYVSRKPFSRHELCNKLSERFLPRSESTAAQNYQSRFFQRTLRDALECDVSVDYQQEVLAEVIGEVINRFEDVHLVDDEEYAVVFARSKWRQSKWSPKKIEGELRRRGVDDAVVGMALESVFGEEKRVQVAVESEEDLDNAQAYELVALAKRQYDSYRSAAITDEAKKRRLIGCVDRLCGRYQAISLSLGFLHRTAFTPHSHVPGTTTTIGIYSAGATDGMWSAAWSRGSHHTETRPRAVRAEASRHSMGFWVDGAVARGQRAPACHM